MRVFLLFALLALLCTAVLASESSPSDSLSSPDQDHLDQFGEVPPPPPTEPLCTVDPTTGEETCIDAAAIDSSAASTSSTEVDPLALAAAAEKAEAARLKDLARAKYKAEKAAERAAKKLEQNKEKESEDAARRAKQSELDENGKRKGPSEDDYKMKEPLKKLKVDYYKFFGVTQDTPKLKIRKNVNAMAVANHPDKCDTLECRENMVVINHARDVLLDDETREHYDFMLKYCYRRFDQNLYEDLWEQFQRDPLQMPDNCYHLDRGWSPSESQAGWMLLMIGLGTLGLVASPLIKYAKAEMTRGTREAAKKAAAKQALMESRQQQAAEMHQLSLKKKPTAKFTGDKQNRSSTGGPSPSPSPAPSPSPVPTPSPKNANAKQR
jgi:hypothetical protein